MNVSLLNRASAQNILRLFNLSFRYGVLDAYELGDEYAAKDFLEKHRENWTYGAVGQPDDFDWKHWRFYMTSKFCMFNGLTGFSERYLYSIKTYNYLFCPIIMSMRFYLKGVEEWIEYPNPSRIELFKRAGVAHWKPMPNQFKKITKTENFVDIQEIAYEYSRTHGDAQTVTPNVMKEFCSAMFDLTRKYVSSKRIHIDGHFIKNA